MLKPLNPAAIFTKRLFIILQLKVFYVETFTMATLGDETQIGSAPLKVTKASTLLSLLSKKLCQCNYCSNTHANLSIWLFNVALKALSAPSQ
jgi:hypothetical protein